MDNLTRRVLAHLDALPGQEPWDVLPGQTSPAQPCCGCYASASAAYASASAAGFAVTGDFVPAPPMAGLYDLRTVLKLAKEGPVYLLIARRRAVVTARSGDGETTSG